MDEFRVVAYFFLLLFSVFFLARLEAISDDLVAINKTLVETRHVCTK